MPRGRARAVPGASKSRSTALRVGAGIRVATAGFLLRRAVGSSSARESRARLAPTGHPPDGEAVDNCVAERRLWTTSTGPSGTRHPADMGGTGSRSPPSSARSVSGCGRVPSTGRGDHRARCAPLGADATVIRRLLGTGGWRRARRGVYRDTGFAARRLPGGGRPACPVRGAGRRARRRSGGLAHHRGPAAGPAAAAGGADEVCLTRRPPARSNGRAGATRVHVAEFAAPRCTTCRGFRCWPGPAWCWTAVRRSARPTRWPSPTPRCAGTWSPAPSCGRAAGAARAGPGCAAAALVVGRADPRAESWLESVSRWWLAEAGLPRPALQQRFADGRGSVRARVDFWFPEQRVVGEADGEGEYAEPGRPVRREAAGGLAARSAPGRGGALGDRGDAGSAGPGRRDGPLPPGDRPPRRPPPVRVGRLGRAVSRRRGRARPQHGRQQRDLPLAGAALAQRAGQVSVVRRRPAQPAQQVGLQQVLHRRSTTPEPPRRRRRGPRRAGPRRPGRGRPTGPPAAARRPAAGAAAAASGSRAGGLGHRGEPVAGQPALGAPAEDRHRGQRRGRVRGGRRPRRRSPRRAAPGRARCPARRPAGRGPSTAPARRPAAGACGSCGCPRCGATARPAAVGGPAVRTASNSSCAQSSLPCSVSSSASTSRSSTSTSTSSAA